MLWGFSGKFMPLCIFLTRQFPAIPDNWKEKQNIAPMVKIGRRYCIKLDVYSLYRYLHTIIWAYITSPSLAYHAFPSFLSLPCLPSFPNPLCLSLPCLILLYMAILHACLASKAHSNLSIVISRSSTTTQPTY